MFRAWLLFFPVVVVGCAGAAHDGPVIVVTASYPGASAQDVADTIAAPLEQQLNGAGGLAQIESESRPDGSYVAHLRFEPKISAKAAERLMRDRVDLAAQLLPEEALRGGVSVQAGEARETQPDSKIVAIALMDCGNHDWEQLWQWSQAAVRRFEAENALEKPEVFPNSERTNVLRIDREKCAELGVSVAAVHEAVRSVGSVAKAADLEDLPVAAANGKQLPLGSLATVNEEVGPTAVYRVNLNPAVRITGSLPAGKGKGASARHCLELATAVKPKDATSFIATQLIAK